MVKDKNAFFCDVIAMLLCPPFSGWLKFVSPAGLRVASMALCLASLSAAMGEIRYAAGNPSAEIPALRQSREALSWKQSADSLALREGGTIVWQFNGTTNSAKPFFHPVGLPGGPVQTWDHPPDHPWHHGLWFSWKFINGVNYWEEDRKTGRSEGLTEWSEPHIQTGTDFSARIIMDLRYRPANGESVLTEHRLIEVSPPGQDGSFHLDWIMTFTAGGKEVVLDRTPLPGEPGGKPWGGYAGLSVRFSKEINAAGIQTTQGPAAFAEGVFRGKGAAVDYAGQFENREAGIAILSAAANLNSPSPWYAVSNDSMRYFSPAVIQDRPLTLGARQSFTLRYRVIVHPGRWSADQLRVAVGNYSADPASSR